MSSPSIDKNRNLSYLWKRTTYPLDSNARCDFCKEYLAGQRVEQLLFQSNYDEMQVISEKLGMLPTTYVSYHVQCSSNVASIHTNLSKWVSYYKSPNRWQTTEEQEKESEIVYDK